MSAELVAPNNRSTTALALSSALVTSLLLLASLVAMPAAGASDPVPDLSGTWLLDPDLSGDPLSMMPERPRGGMGRGGPGGGPPGGFGGGGSPGGMPGGGRAGGFGRGPGSEGSSPEEMRERMEALRSSVERLEIVQTANSVRIVFADDHEERFTTDNKKNLVETIQGEAEVKARWKDGRLFVKKTVEKRMTTETYYVTRDGSLLTVVVKMAGEGGMSPPSFKRIYRPVEAERTETGS